MGITTIYYDRCRHGATEYQKSRWSVNSLVSDFAKNPIDVVRHSRIDARISRCGATETERHQTHDVKPTSFVHYQRPTGIALHQTQQNQFSCPFKWVKTLCLFFYFWSKWFIIGMNWSEPTEHASLPPESNPAQITDSSITTRRKSLYAWTHFDGATTGTLTCLNTLLVRPTTY